MGFRILETFLPQSNILGFFEKYIFCIPQSDLTIPSDSTVSATVWLRKLDTDQETTKVK